MTNNKSIMKKLLLTVTLTCAVFILCAQNLTLTDLINLNKKVKWEQMDAMLKKKGWTIMPQTSSPSGNQATWAYKKVKDSNKASAWLIAEFADGKQSKTTYLFGGENAFKNIKKATVVLKLKESSVDNKDNLASVTYKSGSNSLALCTYTGKPEERLLNTPSTSYTVEIFPFQIAPDNLNGIKRDLYSDGTVKKEYSLKNGLLDGAVKLFYPNGKPQSTATYVAGKKSGVEVLFDNSGSTVSEISYNNDIPNGEFKLYEGGRVTIVGNKVNGKSEGSFVSYDPQGRILAKYNMAGDSLQGRYTKYLYGSSSPDKTVSGEYDNGLKNGYWETSIVANGEKQVLEYTSYLQGVKDGKFRVFQGDSLLIGTYKVGKFDGKVEVYIFSNEDINHNDISLTNASIVAYYTYSNGILNGPYERRDKSGNILAKGSMTNDRREGEWIIAKQVVDDNGKPTFIFHKGSFARDIMVGEWVASTIDNTPLKKFSYKNGRIEGKVVEYSWNGKPVREKMIENEKLVKLSLYDSLGTSVSKTIDILQDDNSTTRCKVTTFLPNGYTTCGYWMKKNIAGAANPDTFEKEFVEKSLNSKNPALGGADGELKEYNKNNEVVAEGKYENNSKVGKWKRYYYPMDVIIVTDYSQKVVVDTYLDLPTGKLYSGRFVEAFENGQIKCDKKVYQGLLDGKSKYFNHEGKVVKVETYAQGVLKRTENTDKE